MITSEELRRVQDARVCIVCGDPISEGKGVFSLWISAMYHMARPCSVVVDLASNGDQTERGKHLQADAVRGRIKRYMEIVH